MTFIWYDDMQTTQIKGLYVTDLNPDTIDWDYINEIGFTDIFYLTKLWNPTSTYLEDYLKQGLNVWVWIEPWMDSDRQINDPRNTDFTISAILQTEQIIEEYPTIRGVHYDDYYAPDSLFTEEQQADTELTGEVQEATVNFLSDITNIVKPDYEISIATSLRDHWASPLSEISTGMDYICPELYRWWTPYISSWEFFNQELDLYFDHAATVAPNIPIVVDLITMWDYSTEKDATNIINEIGTVLNKGAVGYNLYEYRMLPTGLSKSTLPRVSPTFLNRSTFINSLINWDGIINPQ